MLWRNLARHVAGSFTASRSAEFPHCAFVSAYRIREVVIDGDVDRG